MLCIARTMLSQDVDPSVRLCASGGSRVGQGAMPPKPNQIISKFAECGARRLDFAFPL